MAKTVKANPFAKFLAAKVAETEAPPKKKAKKK
jgi:hypothetical protein